MVKNLTHKTKGTCSREIVIRINSNIIESVKFNGGCPGNLAGITRLVEGMEVEEVIRRVEGLRCGRRSTSCPDQLAVALKSLRPDEM